MFFFFSFLFRKDKVKSSRWRRCSQYCCDNDRIISQPVEQKNIRFISVRVGYKNGKILLVRPEKFELDHLIIGSFTLEPCSQKYKTHRVRTQTWAAKIDYNKR